jgi:HK97 family phage major capsid protein
MTKLEELIAKREKLLEQMRSMLDTADADEGRDLTDEETTQYSEWDADAAKTSKAIEMREKLEADEADAAARQDPPATPDFPNKRTRKVSEEFENIGEFLHSIRFNLNDPRLQDCDYQEVRDSTMASGVGGGFAVPTQFRPQLLSVDPAQAVFRPRATVIPAGDPPDAEIKMPALDQTAAQNVYGGVVMYKVGEGATLTESDVRIREVSLTPEGIGGYIQITDKLLRNWSASAALLETQLRQAMIGYEDMQFYKGDGVMGPTGILSSTARIDVARAAANAISIADIRNMYARIKMGGSFVWIASQTILPQLMQLQGGNSENIFIFDASAPVPASLLGIPVVFHDRSVGLGTAGDLILADLGYYLIKDGSGPFVATSENVGSTFLTGLTTIKITNMVDGKSWLTAPLPLEGSTSNTVSPFIVLN